MVHARLPPHQEQAEQELTSNTCFYIVNKCLKCNMSLNYHHNSKPNALIVW